ncbi:hypothetical protein L7F22_065574 [Adiantum nelumboides]|nr:hypothetical protein [Adiantum nelumboides]
MHTTCSLSSPAGESLIHLPVTLEVQKQLTQSMDVYEGIGELNQAALQKSLNESIGQSSVLHYLVPDNKRNGAGPIVVCARCFTLTNQGTLSFKPTVSRPFDASVSQEINQAYASSSLATISAIPDKRQGKGYGLKSSVAELVQDEAFSATVCASNVSCNYQRSSLPKAEAVVPNPMWSKSLHDAPVPSHRCVTCNFQSDLSPKPFATEPFNTSVAPSNNHALSPAYLNSQQNAGVPVPHVKSMADIDNRAVPFVYSTWDEVARGHSSHCDTTAYDLTWNILHSAALIDRCYLMEEQSSGQCRFSLRDKAFPVCQCGLGLKAAYKIPMKSEVGHRTGLEGEKLAPSVINLPKCISIRADSHTRQVKTLNDRNHDVKVASNTTGPALSAFDQNKPYGHRRRNAPSMHEVQEQTTVVALAENFSCLTFPQGMYKTEMCNKWLTSMGQYCPYGDKCRFAHGAHELRPVLRHHRYKTILCRMIAAGEPCPYEHRCHFRHVIDPQEAEVLAFNSVLKAALATSK